MTPNRPTDPRDGFTPGPWRASDLGYVFSDRAQVARAYGGSAREQIANALLIERSPTLLADNERQAKVIEALVKALAEARQELSWCVNPDGDRRHELDALIDAALALAGGGE